MNVFAKIFSQIFDSSIASDYIVRHVFMDLLVLADRDGVVDMTPDAISRRTNVPPEMVAHALQELVKPDRKSRSPHEQGARIVLVDSHRDWGWQIVNYEHYRNIRDDEARRTYFRDKKREQRANRSKGSSDSQRQSNYVKDSPTMSTKGEGEGELKNIRRNCEISPVDDLKPITKDRVAPEEQILYKAYPRHVAPKAAYRAIRKALSQKSFDELLLSVNAFSKKCRREGTEPQFIPHPATWFNAGRYDDENLTPSTRKYQAAEPTPENWAKAKVPESDL